ncbi:MAG: saccharopine dehydrogenase [Marinilabiliales bacterium]|mgnify:CR=1 FL=1|nr:MAG: saccharopine dehydrogenase [Marinilabiliales bacterium]
MKNILIIGAGLSSSTMISYLLDKSGEYGWSIVVADVNKSVAESKIDNHPNAKAVEFDIHSDLALTKLVSENDIIVSMLPSRFHPLVAEECLKQKKHMFTASYVSPQMRAYDDEAKEKDLLFLNECGVDPGIDHMSAMKVIDDIRNKGGKIISFESNTGGLIAPEYDNNPWNYKFTWNARNVILAGQGTACFRHNNKLKYIPYNRLFERTSRMSVLDYGEFDVYANRDSLMYQEIYGIEDAETIFRGTFRRPGYCEAYNVFIQLGLTDDTYEMENAEKLTNRSYLAAFLPEPNGGELEDVLCRYMNLDRNGEVFRKIEWLGLFEEKKISKGKHTPAQILQSIIEPKWTLDEGDLDMIVMQHRFVYELNGKRFKRLSSMIVIGKDTVDTAMSITVGMPVAFAIEEFLNGKFSVRGVQVPVIPELYEPILEKLSPFGVEFIEEEFEL